MAERRKESRSAKENNYRHVLEQFGSPSNPLQGSWHAHIAFALARCLDARASEYGHSCYRIAGIYLRMPLQGVKIEREVYCLHYHTCCVCDIALYWVTMSLHTRSCLGDEVPAHLAMCQLLRDWHGLAGQAGGLRCAVLHLSFRARSACVVSSTACAQPGDRYRSFDPARRERFVARIAGMLSDPRCTQVCPSGHHCALAARYGAIGMCSM